MNDEYEGEHVAEESKTSVLVVNNKLYDGLKFLALVLLPALGTLYYGLAPYWDLPKADEVAGSVLLIDTFLGVLIRFMKNGYDNSDAKYDGELEVFRTPEGDAVRVVSNHEIDKVASKKAMTLRVQTK